MISPENQAAILFDNIQCLCVSWKEPDKEAHPITSFDGIRIVTVNNPLTGFRRIVQKEHYAEAISHTAELFAEVQERWLVPFLDFYRNYLATLKEGHRPKGRQAESARLSIQQWRSETANFQQLLEQDPRPHKVQRFIDQWFKGENPFTARYENIVTQCLSICRLEVASRCLLPLHEWHIMAKYNEQVATEKAYAEWIEKFQRHRKESDDAEVLNEGLAAITDFFREIDPSVEFSLGLIAFGIWKNSRTFLQTPHQKHVQWRNTIQVGAEIHGMHVTHCFRETVESDDKWIYYLDDPRYMIKIFQNPLIALAHAYSLTLHQLPIPMVDIIYVDPEGRYLLMERLEDCVEEVDWKDVSALTPSHTELLESRVALMSYFIANKWCPSISLSHFKLTTTGELRALRPFVKKAFWLEPLQDLALATAKGNPIVYTHLMNRIAVQKMDVYALYKVIVQDFSKGEQGLLTSGSSRIHLGSHQSEWATRMKALRGTIHEIREAALAIPHAEEAVVTRAIMAYYQRTRCLSSLLSDAKEVILKEVEQQSHSSPSVFHDGKRKSLHC